MWIGLITASKSKTRQSTGNGWGKNREVETHAEGCGGNWWETLEKQDEMRQREEYTGRFQHGETDKGDKVAPGWKSEPGSLYQNMITRTNWSWHKHTSDVLGKICAVYFLFYFHSVKRQMIFFKRQTEMTMLQWDTLLCMVLLVQRVSWRCCIKVYLENILPSTYSISHPKWSNTIFNWLFGSISFAIFHDFYCLSFFSVLHKSAAGGLCLLFAAPLLCPAYTSPPPTFFAWEAILIIDQMAYLSHTSDHHYLPNRISMLAGLRWGSFTHISPVIGPIIKLEAFPRCASVNGACEKTGFSA